jgi:hypothetical protein
MTCFKLHSISRSLNQDTTEFSLLGLRYRLSARPIQLWKFVYWGRWKSTDQRRWAIQTPWLTLAEV